MPDSAPQTSAVVAAMRNEGLFVLEWVAYHRLIGFDRIVICTNDCTDGSDRLLDVLQDRGFVTHLRTRIPVGGSPQEVGFDTARAALFDGDIEWVCHIDADEFLNIGLGLGLVRDLLDEAGEGDVIALPWWHFGDAGQTEWRGDILPTFTTCETAPDPETVKFKSMFRFRKFAGANDHMPVRPLVDEPVVMNARGEELRNAPLFAPKRAKYRPIPKALRHKSACVNHYAVKSRDVFLMKNDRGDGQGKSSQKYYLGSRWHTRANCNDGEDHSIQRHWPGVAAILKDWRADAGIGAAEKACIDWFTARKAHVLTPDTIAAWTHADYTGDAS